jgi:hypothetical protein
MCKYCDKDQYFWYDRPDLSSESAPDDDEDRKKSRKTKTW